jgi:hypothetical protein
MHIHISIHGATPVAPNLDSFLFERRLFPNTEIRRNVLNLERVVKALFSLTMTQLKSQLIEIDHDIQRASFPVVRCGSTAIEHYNGER